MNSRLEGPGRHELRHQDGAFVAPQRRLPGVEESDDVRMLQSFQHLHLLSEPLTLRLVQTMSLRGQRSSISQPVHLCNTWKQSWTGSLAFALCAKAPGVRYNYIFINNFKKGPTTGK